MDHISEGNPAPDFELTDAQGGRFRLSSLRGKKVVLYFFPKAFTGGCTMETEAFAQLAPQLKQKGVEVVGVSVDPAETQQRFAEHCHVSFPLLADSSKEAAKAYGVLSFIGLSKRVTFYIDEQGVVRDVVSAMMPGPHLSRAKQLYLASA